LEQEKYSHEKSGRKSVPAELTIEAAIIELNRLKSQERMDIDRERLNAAIDKLIGAARYRIKQAPKTQYYENQSGENGYKPFCPRCDSRVFEISDNYCPECGQALDWGD